MTTPNPTTPETPHCFVCQQTADAVPLIQILYRGAARHICPQHLPVLIHNPQQLANVLPGAESLPGADSH